MVSLEMGVVESQILMLGTKWVWLSQNSSGVGYEILRINKIRVWLQFSPRLETIQRVWLTHDWVWFSIWLAVVQIGVPYRSFGCGRVSKFKVYIHCRI